MLFVLMIWFILALIIASAASQRGRDATGWFLISIITTPLLAGILLLLFPPLRDPALAVDDNALQEAIRKGMEPTYERSIGGPIIILAGLILVAVTTYNSDVTREATSETITAIMHSAAPRQSTTKNGYAAAASLPCATYLNAYGTTQFSSLTRPLIETISARDNGLGSGANIIDFVGTECRLHEEITIGQAVENLFNQQRQNRLPRIPIGGATSEPQDRSSWVAFDKWIHHRGPRPEFGTTSPSTGATMPKQAATDADVVTPSFVPQPLVIRIDVTVSGNARPTIAGTTNLPDGTRLMIALNKPSLPDSKERLAVGLPACGGDDCLPLTVADEGKLADEVVVKNGRFNDGPFTNHGAALSPGTYVLDVWNMIVEVGSGQPPEVLAIIGKHGENLAGPLLNACCLGFHFGSAENLQQLHAEKERRSRDESARRDLPYNFILYQRYIIVR